MNQRFSRLKRGCYTYGLSTAVVPQLIGIITDASAVRFPNDGESLGMKLGMLPGALCPLGAAILIRKLSKQEIDCKET